MATRPSAPEPGLRHDLGLLYGVDKQYAHVKRTHGPGDLTTEVHVADLRKRHVNVE